MRGSRTTVALVAVAAAMACSGGRGIPSADNAQLYEKARLQIQGGKVIKARKTLGLVGLAEPIEADLDPLVKLATADAFFFQSGGLNVIEAQSRYQQFLNFYPTHARAPYAQYQLGECLLLQSEAPTNDQEFTVRAISEFKKVPDLDPRSAYARASQSRLEVAEGKLAEKEWIVARFYAKRKKWQAVVGRLRSLLEDHPGYWRRDEVFLMLGHALVETGNLTEGRIYLQKLQADDPDGELGAKAGEILRRAGQEPL